MKRIEYTVTGNSSFPLDMLRYDSAWPAKSEDAFAIGMDGFWSEGRTIKLYSYQEPSQGRWESFGFTCSTPKNVA